MKMFVRLRNHFWNSYKKLQTYVQGIEEIIQGYK